MSVAADLVSIEPVAVQMTFDYDSLDSDTRAFVEELDAELDAVMKRAFKDIGLILQRAKDRLSHGEYEAWIASKGIPKTTAWRYRQIAQGKDPKSSTLEHLDENVVDQPVEPVEEAQECVILRTPREVVEEWFSEYPTLTHLSNREIAKRCGVTEGTVRNYKKELLPEITPQPEPKTEPEIVNEPESEIYTPPDATSSMLQDTELAEVALEAAIEDKPFIIAPLEETETEQVVEPEPEKLPKIEPSEEVQRERETRRQQVQERNEQLREKGVDLPTGKYSCLVVDPPWAMQKIEREERPNQFEFDYPTMSEGELKNFPLPDLAADDCHLYLWTTQKHLPLALRLAEYWGFKYQCLMTWVKNVGFTPFSWMYSTEHVLFCTKGSLPLLEIGRRLDFGGKVRDHSRKPDEFYEIVRDVSPGPRLDVFSREKRDGFEQYGNEVEKFAVQAR